MCGITGLVRGSPSISLEPAIKKMTMAMKSRGPDHQGYWLDEKHGVALGHARLSILDLSAAAAQPFTSEWGDHALVFNGEIYNHAEIAAELRALGHQFRTKSDTEVLLKAIVQWGCEEAVKKAAGMFAFAFYDRSAQLLWLGRDRMGEKPLYYGWWKGSFLFASELKALFGFPGFGPSVDSQALNEFLRYSCVPAPRSIYSGVQKLEPAKILRIDLRSKTESVLEYWSLAATAAVSHSRRSENDYLEDLERILGRAVGQQMLADVPVGAFLSGGIDSSLLVALMQERSSRPVRTFTIGFHQHSFNEAVYAKRVAEHLGTDHTELYVTAAEARDVIPRLPWIYDEPFADSSQIPTFLVAALARSQVKVCLSGDGGDEVFAGYNRHFLGATLWKKLRYVPSFVKDGIAAAAFSIPARARNRAAQALERALPGLAPKHLPEKVEKLLQCLRHKDELSLYFSLLAQIQKPSEMLRPELRHSVTAALPMRGIEGGAHTMQYLDSVFYLPNDILAKVDRATMAVGLESRAPYLDHRLVEFAWTLPSELRVRDRAGKWALRRMLDRRVPRELVERPKSGFAIPINDWLRGNLRDWAESLLSDRALAESAVFHPKAVQDLWSAYLAGRENSQYQVWNILMYQSWHARKEEHAHAKNNPIGKHGLVSL